MPEPLPPGRRRRSPLTRGGRPTLTADVIAAAMLELAGRSGFQSVSMQVLAEHLGVTVRALYRHVRDRHEIVDRAIELWLSSSPAPNLDPADWRAGLTEYCRRHRAINRRHPRALLVSLDELVTDARLPENRLTGPEELLQFLTALGLDLRDALFVHTDLNLRLFAFTLLVDYRADLGQPIADQYPVPDVWLEKFPDLTLPHLRQASADIRFDPDELFDRIVTDVIETVARLRTGRDTRQTDG